MARFRRQRAFSTDFGAVVRSAFEKRVLNDLHARGVKFEYEAESLNWYEKQRGVCRECGARETWIERWYTPDVFLPQRDGTTRIVEIKGKFTARDRKIALGVRALHPEIDFRFLFQKDNWLTKKQVQRYSDWATKHKFTFATGGRIPEEWV